MPPRARKKTKIAGKAESIDSMVRRHKQEAAELGARHAKERKDSKARQKKELDAAKEAARDTVATAVAEGETECADCNEELSEASTCFECINPLCSECSSQCEVCDNRYCSSCRDKNGECNGCSLGDMFTCGGCCEKMPCGELEHGDCIYYHHKHCRCQREGD